MAKVRLKKIRICKDGECNNAATSGGFCRLHYLKNWKKIQTLKRKKAAKNLNRYVESILNRNPDRYVEAIKGDIRSRKFEQFVDERFSSEEPANLFDPTNYEENVENLLTNLKVDKDY